VCIAKALLALQLLLSRLVGGTIARIHVELLGRLDGGRQRKLNRYSTQTPAGPCAKSLAPLTCNSHWFPLFPALMDGRTVQLHCVLGKVGIAIQSWVC